MHTDSSSIATGISIILGYQEGIANDIRAIKDGIANLPDRLDEILKRIGTQGTETIMHLLNTINRVCVSIRDDVAIIRQILDDFFQSTPTDEDGQVNYTSWDNFWGSFQEKNVHDFIVDLLDELKNGKDDEQNYSGFVNSFASEDDNTIFGASKKLSTEINTFTDSIDGTTASSISVPYSYSSFLGGKSINTTLVVSNSWWTPYKAKSDSIISAFLWITFLFSFFSNLGNILEGNGWSIKIHRTYEYEINDYERGEF